MRTYKTTRTTTVETIPSLPPARRRTRPAGSPKIRSGRLTSFALGDRVALIVEVIDRTAPDEYEVRIVGADDSNVMLANDLALGQRL